MNGDSAQDALWKKPGTTVKVDDRRVSIMAGLEKKKLIAKLYKL
jgi:hypothetical protein